MYFNFDDAHPETPSLDRAISIREGVLLSVVLHAVGVVLLLFGSRLPFVQAALARIEQARQEAVEARIEQQQRGQDRPTFVFVQPRVDTPAPLAPPRAELSDMDRSARAPERAENPTNPLPFARGNSAERVEGTPDARTDDRASSATEEAAAAAAAAGAEEARAANGREAAALADRGRLVAPPGEDAAVGNRGRGLAGAIGEALRNIEKYVPESFNNPQGGVQDFGSTIQFDTKGVEFGPWIRRFVAQVKRNWFIPYAAMSMRGHVVLQFYVHRDGSITDLTVVRPSSVDAFTNAAYNAMAASNPTQPLPPEYPSDRVLFTVTFYYNESPGRDRTP